MSLYQRRRPSSGLLSALRAVEGMTRAPVPTDSPNAPGAFARGYNAGLWDARSAIMREIHAAARQPEPALEIEPQMCVCGRSAEWHDAQHKERA
jgi:hypothetical protein